LESHITGKIAPGTNTLYALVNGFSSGGLATVNVATGAATTIGSGTNISNLMALSFGSNGTLYAASWSTNSLYTINTSTGSASLVGALGFGGIMDLAFDSHGTLYGVSNGLYTINTTTGAGTQVAASAGSGCLMAMTIEGGNGFATDYCTGSSPLYHLDLTNGSVTSIGNTGISNPMALTYMGAAGAVPEPASWALMLVGFAGIGVAARRRQHVAVTFG